MVAAQTGLGVLLGDVLEALAAWYWPSLSHGVIASAMAITGFGVGWWCFATVGRRWFAEDQHEAELEHEE
jgi:hypothetical protein